MVVVVVIIVVISIIKVSSIISMSFFGALYTNVWKSLIDSRF